MSEAEVIGSVIIALISILTLIGLMINPIIKFNSNIVMLNETMKNLSNKIVEQDNRLNSHSRDLDRMDRMITRHTVEIGNLKKESD